MGSNWIETAKALYQGSGYKVAETDKSGDKYLEFKLI